MAKDTDPAFDRAMMLRAVRLARRGIGRVAPNPPVGCVLVDPLRHTILGEGYHAELGSHHGEAAALNDCRRRGRDPQGAVAYVTLEPCAHHGRTPPCSDALIDAGIKRVVIGREDPNPVADGGAEQLRAAGIAVDTLELEETRRLTNPFVKRVTTGLPWVIVKWAQTLDGRIATRTGDSKWISNAQSRAAVHRLRARMDAIVTGVGTVLADDPMLTARDVRRHHRVARRVVLDPGMKMPADSRLVSTAGDTPTIWVTNCAVATRSERIVTEARGAGVEIWAIGSDDDSLGALAEATLRQLVTEHGATNVLVEAGGGVIGALLERGLIDELVVYLAPKVLGDAEAMAPARGRVIDSITNATPFVLRRTRRLGDDVELRYERGPNDG
ncbi:MAG: bifunctional diaminohydroxyphosphoribosylaminopyrimidine deaminase/5-amino-6-(5-phosphoribosylamino)uracil reductase RibD [Phycisphaerales bacterium]